MSFTERQELIQSYENQIDEYEKKFEELLTELSWDFETLKIRKQETDGLMTCPFNAAHKVPVKSYERHHKSCELKQYGITSERGRRKQVPSSAFFYQNSPVVLSLNKEELQKTAADGSANSSVGQGLTVSQRLEEYEKEMAAFNRIRSERKQQRRDDYQNFDEIWEAVQKKKGENQGYKSRAELLAEQRDYKRRRKSYRAKNIKITQRTPTQVHRDLIAAYMEDFKLLKEFEMESQSGY
ncbi:2227_t:CDS:2 [Acaulospora morrowiae]|uniref:2227_t:CDS:1 n=1 Tax=Acaulospora morrowiae TaxID=94023 RepID=A0A9N9FFY6_9GLOM|nr:2227_t:CDS:2 [Acaulospora morrowiae]